MQKQKGDDDQQQPSSKSEEISEYYATATWSNDAPYTSVVSSNNYLNYNDIVKVLSEVELPSPSPLLSTSRSLTGEDNLLTFHQGQTSGTTKIYNTEGNIDQEMDRKDEKENVQEPGRMQFVAPQTHNTERRPARSRIHERIRALKALVPSCNKTDQASILDDVISYIKSLQIQLQTVQLTKVAPYFAMRPMIGVGYAPGHLYASSCFTSSIPTFPLFVGGFNPLVPPSMEMGTESPRLLSIQRLQFPSQTSSEPMYSTTSSSSHTINYVPTTDRSQVGPVSAR